MKNILLLFCTLICIYTPSKSQVSDSIQWIKMDHNDGVLSKEFGKTQGDQFKIQVEFKFKKVGSGSIFIEEIESKINAQFNYYYEVLPGEISTIYYTAEWKTEYTSIEMYTDIIRVHFKDLSPIRMTYTGVFVGDEAIRLKPDSNENLQFMRDESFPHPSPILKVDSKGNPIEYGSYSPSGKKIGLWYNWDENGYFTTSTKSIVMSLKVDQYGKPNSKDPNCFKCPLKSRIKEEWYEPERLGYVENSGIELISLLPDSQYLEMKTPSGLAQGGLFPLANSQVKLSAFPSDWVEVIGNSYWYKIENNTYSYAIEYSTDPKIILNRLNEKYPKKNRNWFTLDSISKLILVDLHGLAPKKHLSMIAKIEEIEGVEAMSPYIFSSLDPHSRVILSGIIYAEIRGSDLKQVNEILQSCGLFELAENYNYYTELRCLDRTISGILKSTRCLSESPKVYSVQLKIGGSTMHFEGLEKF